MTTPTALGWLAVLLGLFLWWLDFAPPGRVTAAGVVDNLRGHAYAGAGAAVGLGLGLWAARRGSDRGVAGLAVGVNAGLVVFEMMRVASHL